MGERELGVARVEPACAAEPGSASVAPPRRLDGSSGHGPTCVLVPSPEAAGHRRVHALVNEHMNFVWRSLRRLGVPEADCDDGCQRVWVVVAQKLAAIDDTKVRSFVFSVVVRVASEMRRNQRRHQHVAFDELDLAPARADTERLLDQRRVRELLDRILSGLSWDLRTVFVMYEIEGMSSPEIADALGLRRGTVASRLRLAREAFARSLQRHRARTEGLTPRSGPPSAAGSAAGSTG